MPEYIIKINEMYLLYSTVVDSPTTWGMSYDDLQVLFKELRGAEGLVELSKRMSRVEEKGTSCYLDTSARDTVRNNHAGPDGIELTLEEIYEAYCLREPILNNWRPQEA